MENQKSRSRAFVWILVLVAVVLLWWMYRPATDNGDRSADLERASASASFDRDAIIVDFRDDLAPETLAAIEKRLDIDLVLVSDEAADEQFYRARVDPARQDALLDTLAAHPDVELVEPDATYSAAPMPAVRAPAPDIDWQGFPDDPRYAQQWHMSQIHMPEAWKLADGEGVIVAVLDTGVAYEAHSKFHQVEDLAGVEFVKPYDFVGNDRHANDDHGHGTHVAGTIAQATHNGIGVTGVARNVKIMPLKVLSGSGSGSVAGIADAIRYAADNGAHVINMSLGGPFPSRALKNAVKYAHDKGVVVVCAAGNDGRSKVGYPAAFPGAVAVSATQFDESVTFYSNYGKNIDIAAPGGNTRVDQNGDGLPDGVLQNTIAIGNPGESDYFAYMGTSMASPHAAGVAALVVGEGVTDPKAVEKILKDTARSPKSGKLDKQRYGAGLIDAEAAVRAARSQAGAWQFALAMLMALAVAGGLRTGLGLRYLAGAGLAASGLFFLPLIAPSVSSWPVIEMLTRGVPSWDLALLGPSGHGNALFFSALIPLGLLGLGFGSAKLRPVVVGATVGIAAHLLFHAAASITDIRWMVLDPVWLALNAGLCVVAARVALRRVA